LSDKGKTKGTWEVRILNGTYRTENNETVVELYGRSKDGVSILIRKHGFLPYFYLVEPSEAKKARLRSELDAQDQVLGLDDETLWVWGKERKCLKVTLRFPFRVPEYRNNYAERSDFGEGTNVLAADILFVNRFVFDNDIGGCTKVTGYEEPDLKKRYTVDLVVEAEKFEDCEPFHPPLTILSFDIENSVIDKHIFTVCLAVRKGRGDIVAEALVGTEKEILEGFQECLVKYDPDVVTGYNIDNYDIPMMLERGQKFGLKMQWGRDFGEITSRSERFWSANGRVIADAWWNAKKQLRPKKETLNAIADLVLGERKDDVDPKKIDEEWAKDQAKVIKYCKKDADLALRILEKIAILEKSMDLATVSRLPLNEVINGMTSTLIDSILIREADRNHIGVPLTRRNTKSDKIEGGYVHTIEPGVYHWVIVLDFKSMYPSIIITNNLCFTTLSKDGDIISPYKDDVRFLSKEKKEGLFPRILGKLMKERDSTKKKSKEAKAAGKAEEAKYYNGLQDAIKILMNSFYGVLASDFYRFTDNNIGASITAFARRNITEIIKTLENEHVNVIYGDTDSIFLSSLEQNLEGARKFGDELAKRFSHGSTSLEFEKVMEPFFTHGAKKRYVGRVQWPTQELLVRGYETRRTDAFDYQSETLMRIFEMVLDGDPEEAVKHARQMVDDVLAGKVPIEKLVISRTVKEVGENAGAYANPDRMANVQAATKLIKLGYTFIPGMKVSWIVTNGKRTPQEVEPYIDGRPFTGKPDWDYYARRVATSLSRVTETFGWQEKELLSGLRQGSLFDDFGGSQEKKDNGGGAPKAGPKKKAKEEKKGPVTLTDFM
jgi:DNA polymerase I